MTKKAFSGMVIGPAWRVIHQRTGSVASSAVAGFVETLFVLDVVEPWDFIRNQ